jgi:uncharacterized membrane protein YdjX (TVP38/TMEM64 family)
MASMAARSEHAPNHVRLLQIGALTAAVAVLSLIYAAAPPVRAGLQDLVAVLAGGDAGAIRDYLQSFGPWGPVVSVVLMVAQALAAPIPHVLVVFANGLAFGVGGGLAVSVTGQTVAAAVCFWLARAVGRGPAEALAGRFGLGSADRWFARWGTAGVVVARLVPGVAFDAVSFAAGLSGMRFGAFVVATALGSAPQALLYAYLGERAPHLVWWLLAGSLAASGLVAAVAIIRSRRAAGKAPA